MPPKKIVKPSKAKLNEHNKIEHQEKVKRLTAELEGGDKAMNEFNRAEREEKLRRMKTEH